MTTMNWKTRLAILVLAVGFAAPMARAELVYEDEQSSADAASNPALEDRLTTREAVGAAERAPRARSAQQPPVQVVVNPAPAAYAQPAYAAVAPAQPQAPSVQQIQVSTQTADAGAVAAQGNEVEHYTQTELMRRSRMREEMRNEDLLQRRLEELRLRDEKKRSDQLIGGKRLGEDDAVAVGAAGATEEVVVAPVTNTPGAPGSRDAVLVSQASAVAVVPGGSSAEAISAAPAEDRPVFFIQPRAGMSSLKSSTLVDTRSRFGGGLGLGVLVGDALSFELGYTYSEYGIAFASSNPYLQDIQARLNGFQYQSSSETFETKQNLVDLSMRLFLTGSGSRLRPFLLGGGGYAKSYTNYSSSFRNRLKQYGQTAMLKDYELNQFVGTVGLGFDVRVTKSISVGAQFRYNSVLSANENQNMNEILGQPLYGPATYDPEKQFVGNSLAKASFYSLLAGVTFSL